MSGFTSADGWIVLTAFLAAASSSVLGCYLVLRRMSLIGDAISHAVLPGIVVAFLISGSRASLPMLLGAAAFGLLCAVLIQALEKTRRVYQDAAIGIAFTSLFALGVVMIGLFANNVDLDQQCVLYGEIAYVPLYPKVVVGGLELAPPATLVLALAFALDLGCVLLLWKELLVSSFDPALATAMGFSAMLLHYVLMLLTSLTVVASFEAVGAILVLAMLVGPPATAYLLTDRLPFMLIWALVISAAAAFGGKLLAAATATSIAGAMAAVVGALFVLAFLFAPRHGVIARAWTRWSLRTRVARENLLAELLRAGERGEPIPRLETLAERFGWSKAFMRWMLFDVRRRELIYGEADALVLSPRGRELAEAVRRRHREWQRRLEGLGYDREHAHASAHRLEHAVSPDVLLNAEPSGENGAESGYDRGRESGSGAP